MTRNPPFINIGNMGWVNPNNITHFTLPSEDCIDITFSKGHKLSIKSTKDLSAKQIARWLMGGD